MRDEIRRTGVPAYMLLRGDPEKPVSLRLADVVSWLRAPLRPVRQAHLDYVLAKWASLPDRTAPPRHLTRRDNVKGYVPLTPEMSRHLRAELGRTGLRVSDLASTDADAPPSLTTRVINVWLYGHAKTVNEACWTYVLAKLTTHSAEGPTPALTRARSMRFPDYRRITTDERAALRRERERTGLGANQLLEKAADRPEDLTIARVTGWLSGKTKTACPRHIDYVLACYAGKPSRAST